MNTLKTYVTNITSDIDDNGWHTLICDTDCWGHREFGTTVSLSPRDYASVKEKGYYLS